MRFKGRDLGLVTNVCLKGGVGRSFLVTFLNMKRLSLKSKPKNKQKNAISGLFCLNMD